MGIFDFFKKKKTELKGEEKTNKSEDSKPKQEVKPSELETKSTSESLEDKTIVITGVFENHSRDELKKMIESKGGKASSSVTKNTAFILSGSNMGPKKKLQAEELGIKIIGEAEFIKQYISGGEKKLEVETEENKEIKTIENSNPINSENVLAVKEFLISNSCTIKLNVIEELYSSFQIMDNNGNVYSPNDKDLSVDDGADLNEELVSWKKKEKIYIGRITRNQWFEFPLDDFLEYLDEFIEEEDKEGDLEDFVLWAYDMHGMSFEESAGGGSCEQYTAWGKNDEYMVSENIMHDQRVYDLKILIES